MIERLYPYCTAAITTATDFVLKMKKAIALFHGM